MKKNKTNIGKFKILPLAVKKKEPKIRDGSVIPYLKEGTILGLYFNTRGTLPQIKYNKLRANGPPGTLK